MAKILSRSAWTSTRAGGAVMSMSRSRGIVVHYPAAGRAIGVISQAQEASRLRGWRNYHVNSRGWADIGYSFAVTQAGRIYEGRGLRTGAHATGHNSTTVGVLFIVGDNEALTPAAKKAFRDLRAWLRRQGAGAGLWGHQQMAGASTRCPGPYIMGSIRDGSLTGGPITPPTPAPVEKGLFGMTHIINDHYAKDQAIEPGQEVHLRVTKNGTHCIAKAQERGQKLLATVRVEVHGLPEGHELSLTPVIRNWRDGSVAWQWDDPDMIVRGAPNDWPVTEEVTFSDVAGAVGKDREYQVLAKNTSNVTVKITKAAIAGAHS